MPASPGVPPSTLMEPAQVYRRDCLIWVLPCRLGLGAGGPKDSHVTALVVARAVGKFTSGPWPASGVGGFKCGYRVDGPLNLPRGSLSGFVPNSGSQGTGVLFRTLGWPQSSPQCRGEWMPLKQAGR